MYNSADKEKYEDKRFSAAIQGIDIDDGGKGKPSKGKSVREQIAETDAQFMFSEQSDYSNMSEEEKEAETKKMLSHWKGFSLSSSPKA